MENNKIKIRVRSNISLYFSRQCRPTFRLRSILVYTHSRAGFDHGGLGATPQYNKVAAVCAPLDAFRNKKAVLSILKWTRIAFLKGLNDVILFTCLIYYL